MQKYHPLSALLYNAHDVTTQVRLLDPQRPSATKELLRAAIRGAVNELRLLLKYGIAPASADHTGRTTLMAAPYIGMTQAQERLLEYGATIDTADVAGYTALMVACIAGKTESVACSSNTARISIAVTTISLRRSWLRRTLAMMTLCACCSRGAHIPASKDHTDKPLVTLRARTDTEQSRSC